MQNTMMENESKRFTNISIFCLRSFSQIMVFVWFTVIVFAMMKLLAVLVQLRQDKAMIKEP